MMNEGSISVNLENFVFLGGNLSFTHYCFECFQKAFRFIFKVIGRLKFLCYCKVHTVG